MTQQYISIFSSQFSLNPLNRLYPELDPNSDVIYKSGQTRQTNGTACGVHAICFAILLTQGKKPEEIRLKLDRRGHDSSKYLRDYLINIVNERQISLIPVE